MRNTLSIIFVFLAIGCEPFVTEFSDSEDPLTFKATAIPDSSNIYLGGNIKVVSWNIRFGIGRFPFFGDSCGDQVIVENQDLEDNMSAIATKINEMNADVVLLQEVDIESKRTGYLNQVQYLLDNTYLNYAVYASMWEVDFVPSHGLGRVNTGNAILSKYDLTDGERIKLALRTDHEDSLEEYFYLRRNILKVNIPALQQGEKNLFAVNIHATAFATDDTKQKHIDKYIEELNIINTNGDIFVSGGDLNSVPPGSSIDFCDKDKCDEDDSTYVGDHVSHREGSYFNNFTDEPNILSPLYNDYQPAIDAESYNLEDHFTHAPVTSMIDDSTFTLHDRKLDYLFTNGSWDPGSGNTHQDLWELSDHMPVSADFIPINE